MELLRENSVADKLALFQAQRSRLHAIAYRMLGTRADAEDAVQDAYVRWDQEAPGVCNPQAWLVAMVTRLCIDRLRRARIERKAYKGPWLPEPIVTVEASSPEEQAELASDVSTAFMVAMERLEPEERAALLLREVCDSDYQSIAEILGKPVATCRQIVHRAQMRVRRDKRRVRHVNPAAQERLVDGFIAAVQARDRDALVRLFAVQATWTADGGGRARATSKTLRGAGRIAKLVLGFMNRFGRVRLQKCLINGVPGLLVIAPQLHVTALSFHTDGEHILAAYNVVNPDKLHGLPPLAAESGDLH